MTVIAYIGVGSNQDDRRAHCAAAMALISAAPRTRLLSRSSWYLTEPWGCREQDDFINLVLKIETGLTPLELLGVLKAAEAKLKRRKTIPFGPRSIDLDILLYGDLIMQSPELTIPHARLCERGFVLVPLHELAPQLVHPVNRQTIFQLLTALGDTGRIIKFNGTNQ
jgi:2-amino-4-hydroxy-6-hydroxymethyldihydropteridine diphosphokinase